MNKQPLYHNVAHDFWVMSRHADITQAVRSDGAYSNARGVSLDESAWGSHAHTVMSFLAMDAPRHLRLRGLVSKGFTPKWVLLLEPQIQQLTDRYLDEVLPVDSAASLDWIAGFAGRLPKDVISEMVGVPESDRAEIRRPADLLVLHEDGLRSRRRRARAATIRP